MGLWACTFKPCHFFVLALSPIVYLFLAAPGEDPDTVITLILRTDDILLTEAAELFNSALARSRQCSLPQQTLKQTSSTSIISLTKSLRLFRRVNY